MTACAGHAYCPRHERGLARRHRRPCPAGSGAPRRDPGQRDPVTEQTTTDRHNRHPLSGIGYAIAGVLVVLALGAATRFLEPRCRSGPPAHPSKGGQVDRIPGLRNRFGPARQLRAVEARAARRAVAGLPHRVLHQDRSGAARRVDQPEGARHRGRPGHHPGAAVDHHRVRLHLVAGRPARPRRQAARAAGVGGVDLRRERGHRGRRRGAGQEGTTGLRRVAGHRVRAAVDLPAAVARRRARPVRRRRRRMDRRQHRHHRRGRRGRSDRRRGRPADRDHRQDHPERVDRSRRDRADRVLRVEGGAQAAPTRPGPRSAQFWERFPKFVLGFIAASIIGTLYLQMGRPDSADQRR